MIHSLRLTNFRGFADHVIPFRPTTVIVGRNNAGKSTLIEALRLVSLVQNRYRVVKYDHAPAWLELPRSARGITPSLQGLSFEADSVFHQYRAGPAELRACFTTGEEVRIHIGEGGAIFGQIFGIGGIPVLSKAQAVLCEVPRVDILPQIQPLLREEFVLGEDYVRRNASSTLSSQHFRNQLNYFYESFPRFRQLAESSWPTLGVKELVGQGGLPTEPLSLLIRDGQFVAEVGKMGHGLQMWLQVIWFLSRVHASVVILDEPDVYMHPDLQRRLLKLLRGRFSQFIVATHSVEILADVDPDEVLMIDRSKSTSGFAGSLPAVQNLVDKIGGAHNLQLTRLWAAKKCLMVEGEDASILQIWHRTLFPESTDPLGTVPTISIGGWGGWNYAVGTSMLLQNSVGMAIRVYSIFDADYRTPKQLAARKAEAIARGIDLHIWAEKEIENYVLVPEPILRVVQAGATNGREPSLESISKKIDELVRSLKDECFDSICHEYFIEERGTAIQRANRSARERVAEHWATSEGRRRLVCGKNVLRKLSDWCQKEFGASLNATRIARAMTRDDLSPEIVDLLTKIERQLPLG